MGEGGGERLPNARTDCAPGYIYIYIYIYIYTTINFDSIKFNLTHM